MGKKSKANKKTIILTGGGSAGHVTPNLALLPRLKVLGFNIHYIGGNGIEKELVQAAGLPFYRISSGKLRRYLDPKNLTDMFRVVKGLSDAYFVLRKVRPDIVFSKGGFVSVPVVAAAGLLGIPVVVHESDYTPGLANKLSSPFAKKICVSFPETLPHVPKAKGVLTGTPIRESILNGSKKAGLKLCDFKPSENGTYKNTLLVFGGSLGSARINDCVRKLLPKLVKCYNIVHICGKGKLLNSSELDASVNASYRQFEYVNKELADLFAMSDAVISRAGANSIFELLALKKPHLLIPLPKGSTSRGDQILNANSFKEQGFSKVLTDEQMTPETLFVEIADLMNNRAIYTQNMQKTALSDGADRIVNVITGTIG